MYVVPDYAFRCALLLPLCCLAEDVSHCQQEAVCSCCWTWQKMQQGDACSLQLTGSASCPLL